MERTVYPNRTTYKDFRTRFFDNQDISEANRKAVKEFLEKQQALGVQELRLRKIISTFKQIFTRISPGFDLAGATEDEINGLHKKIRESQLSLNTRGDYVKIVRRYYKVCEGRNARLPEKLDFFKPLKKVTRTVDVADLPSDLEVKLFLTKGMTNSRDKAILWVLKEAGLRDGEMINLDYKDVRVAENAIDINIRALSGNKTGARYVAMIEGYRYIREWVESHPLKEKDSPFFLTLDGNKGERFKRMTPWAVRAMLHRSAERAGLDKSRFYPHIFRHLACTQKAVLGYTEVQHSNYFGHGIEVARSYIHMNADNTRTILLEKLGMAEKEKSVKPCFKCGMDNPFNVEDCSRCGAVLDARKRILTVGTMTRQVAFVNAMLTLHPELGQGWEKICSTEKGKIQELMEEFINGT